MATIEQRIAVLEAKRQNRQFVAPPELLADIKVVSVFWEKCGRNIDVIPPDKMTTQQRQVLAALIKLKLFSG